MTRRNYRGVLTAINIDMYVNIFTMYGGNSLLKYKLQRLAQPRMKLANLRVCNSSSNYTSDRLDRIRKDSYWNHVSAISVAKTILHYISIYT